jgi:hypothetical protein
MKNSVLCCFVVLLAASPSSHVLHGQSVEAGIFNPSDSTLEVRIRPTASVAGQPLSNIVFTLRWQDSYGVSLGNAVSPVHAVSKQGSEHSDGGYRYQKFAAATAQTVNWTASSEVPVLTVAVLQTGQGVGSFELADDAWTASANASWYVELAGIDRTGGIYKGSVADVPLPLNFTSFHAALDGAVVQLRWRAEDVREGAVFIVQRCREGSVWESRGRVDVRGDDTRGLFHFNDALPTHAAGVDEILYRLHYLGPDGVSVFSPELRLRLDAATQRNPQINVYPNPGSGHVTVSLSVQEDGPANLYVLDLLGRRVLTLAEAELFQAGHHVRSLDFGGLPSGSYLLVYDAYGGGPSTTTLLTHRY